MERVTFVEESQIRGQVQRAFRRYRRRLQRLLPRAEILHVGSTAVPGSLTKGDLDIQVRVEREAFRETRRTLAQHFARNTGSTATSSFASFQDDGATPKLG